MLLEEFKQACENGNFDLVKQMASNNTYDWNWCLYGAARGGNMNIIHFFIEKALKNNCFSKIDWNWGLYCAVDRGHMHLIQFFIEKGAEISSDNLKKYNEYLFNKEYIRSIDYNKDLLEEIVSYY